MIRDVVIQVVSPAVAGVAVGVFSPLGAERLTEFAATMTSAVALVSALLCGVAIMVFQLRVQMLEQTTPKPTRRELRLIDETFFDLLWAVVAGFVAAACAMAVSLFVDIDVAQRVFFGLSTAFLLNFVCVTCMCIKRIHAAYLVVSRDWADE